MPHPVRTAITAIFVMSGAGCAADAPLVEVKGECQTTFGGELCTWARAQGEQVIEAGATIPIASIEGAPLEHAAMAWPPVPAAALALPGTGTEASGLQLLTVYWEPMGHPPGPYMTPHFDFHFYLVSAAERAAIDCKDETKPQALPPAYILPDEKLPPDMAQAIGVSTLVGICVPQMGMHALLAAEFEGQATFSGTMVIGYYQGKPIFIEPMISRAMLLKRESFTLPIPEVPGLTGRHPKIFRADYDAERQVYRFTFSDFTASD